MKNYKYSNYNFEVIGPFDYCKNKTIYKINKDIWKKNKGKSGVYVLFTNSSKVNLGIKDKNLTRKWNKNKSNIVYIGSSVNVLRRVNQLLNKGPHVALKDIKKIHNQQAINIGVYFCKTSDNPNLIEKELLIDFAYKHKNVPLINKRVDF